MNRRGFLGSILALGAAPAIVRADSLMRIVPVKTSVIAIDQYVCTSVAINGDPTVVRLDVLYGSRVENPEWKCRVIDSVSQFDTKVGDVITIIGARCDSIRLRLPGNA